MRRLGIVAVALGLFALVATYGRSVRAQPIASIALPPPRGTVQLYAGCNNIALSFPDGTDSETVVQAVTPVELVQAMWRHNAAAGRFEGFSPAAPQASDLVTVNLWDSVWLCVGAPQSEGSTGTVVVTFRPQAIDPITGVDGECWSPSMATEGRIGSFRCMTGGYIYDPCFGVPAQPNHVLCPVDPRVTSDDVTMRVDLSAFKAGDFATGSAWFFVTIDGLACTALTGTVPLDPDGRPLPFGCRISPSGLFTDVFCASPENDHEWTVECYHEMGPRGIAVRESASTYVIDTVWF